MEGHSRLVSPCGAVFRIQGSRRIKESLRRTEQPGCVDVEGMVVHGAGAAGGEAGGREHEARQGGEACRDVDSIMATHIMATQAPHPHQRSQPVS